ncbi:hypothetical protein N7471_009884 [Penicillium samsonianum]|uniref:uncharacterized protein n=1 Tax=Penicillium samsonianum TaxID=1882272 RepID=UPI002547D051|nr:uncharacterized protein N7471_009884 [Penicillium samsonianum]KAJ6128667.1 hypothetical protein N7471_009884 [Penicillium samsonianum]
MNHRFYSHGRDNKSHIKWILKLVEEVKVLEDKINSLQEGPETEEPQVRLHYQSLLSHEVPFSALNHLPEDSHVRILKKALHGVTEALLNRLYKMAPSLNDSGPMVEDLTEHTAREPNEGDYVMRYVLREFLLWQGDREVLLKAKKMETIDFFLRSVPWVLQNLVKFFELLGRPDTLHFLRDAVLDFAVSLDAPDPSSVSILGGPIVIDKLRKMTVREWDIVYSHFSNVVDWATIGCLCVDFEEVVCIKRLIALGRYTDGDGDSGWSHEGLLSNGNPLALFHGFVADTKGFADPPIPTSVVESGVETQKQSRCYLGGRMAKKDPLAPLLIQELVNRSARFIVFVLDKEKAGDFAAQIISCNEDQDKVPWITRKRSAIVGECLDDTPWTIEWSLQNIISDLATLRFLKERNLNEDFFQFFVIDRSSGRDFTIFDEVTDALSLLAGDLALNEVVGGFIRSYLPSDQQEQWLSALIIEDSFSWSINPGNLLYEGNRTRAWDVLDRDPSFLSSVRKMNTTHQDRRFIHQMLSEMENIGIISVLKCFEPSFGHPLVLEGTDGHEDLYFSYYLNPLSENTVSKFEGVAHHLFTSLCNFPRGVKAKHPSAVFAKGRIHVHYCAWPMTPTTRIAPFRTHEGHIYKWNYVPFDYPLASHLWQAHVQAVMNKRFPFVHFYQTTFIISASHLSGAAKNIKILTEAAKKEGWKLSIPDPRKWTADVDELEAPNPWKGISPVALKPSS